MGHWGPRASLDCSWREANAIKQANVVAASVLIVLGLFFGLLASGHESDWGRAGVFPLWIGLMLIVCAVAYLVNHCTVAPSVSTVAPGEKGWLI